MTFFSANLVRQSTAQFDGATRQFPGSVFNLDILYTIHQ
jgi:hypothetical protein